MKDSKALLLEYLASVRDPERAASLFADDGAFELPFLRSLGVGPRYTGRREITALLQQLHRSEEHTSELQSQSNIVCRLLLEKHNMDAGRQWACPNVLTVPPLLPGVTSPHASARHLAAFALDHTHQDLSHRYVEAARPTRSSP